MRGGVKTAFEEYVSQCTEEDRARIERFFMEFSSHCLIDVKEKRKLRSDFENAIAYYVGAGFPLSRALTLLDIKYMGGFYARPPLLWFPLDDAAKIYPLSMDHGKMSVFRLSVYLKEPVVPVLLQMALNFTIKRFPSFATTLKKGFFWHYLDTAKRRFCVELERDIPCQPLKVSQSGSQSFRVLYYGNRISVEFFHVLTDGTGGMTFLKVLLSEYLRLTDIGASLKDDLWDVNAIPETEEFENAFTKVPRTAAASGFVDKPALQLSGRLSENKPCRLLHFKMNADELKAAAKRYDATVTTYMLALMFLAAKAATDALSGEVSFQLPVNMRKYYPSKTVRNFSMYCGIRLPIARITSVADIIAEIGNQVKHKTSRKAMGEMLNATEKMVDLLKFVPLFLKQPAAKAVYGFLGDSIFTSTLSNLGVVRLPDAVSGQIESMDFVLGTSVTNRAGCSMVTVNDTATFSIAKMTQDPSFEEKLYDLLCGEGIAVLVEGSELYGC